ncbi:MAG: hypothetical protein R3181_05930 [Rubricoccaceae bacterium]|nr:hypothetical protein [Rubricoccaceae bacterium]
MDDKRSAAALHAFALIAAFRTALGVSRGIAGRRAGQDPTENEPAAPVRAYLRAATGRLGGLLVQLRLRLAAGSLEDDHAALVQAFEDRLALADLAEELRIVHQKLLSLYPRVDAEVVEAIRQRHRDARTLAEAEGLPGAFEEALTSLLERLADDLAALRAALVERA